MLISLFPFKIPLKSLKRCKNKDKAIGIWDKRKRCYVSRNYKTDGVTLTEKGELSHLSPNVEGGQS